MRRPSASLPRIHRSPLVPVETHDQRGSREHEIRERDPSERADQLGPRDDSVWQVPHGEHHREDQKQEVPGALENPDPWSGRRVGPRHQTEPEHRHLVHAPVCRVVESSDSQRHAQAEVEQSEERRRQQVAGDDSPTGDRSGLRRLRGLGPGHVSGGLRTFRMRIQAGRRKGTPVGLLPGHAHRLRHHG